MLPTTTTQEANRLKRDSEESIEEHLTTIENSKHGDLLNDVGDNFDSICETSSPLKNHQDIMISLLGSYENGSF